MFVRISVLCLSIASFQLTFALADCSQKLEGEACHATGGTTFCSLAFPSYDDECADEMSMQLNELTTNYHWPETIYGGEWGLSNIRLAPPGVMTVCTQARECVFKEGVGNDPDICDGTGQPWSTWDDEFAYDWDDVCQAPE